MKGFDFHKSLSTLVEQVSQNEGDFDDVEFAKVLNDVDLAFFKSLRINDFFFQPTFDFSVSSTTVFNIYFSLDQS